MSNLAKSRERTKEGKDVWGKNNRSLSHGTARPVLQDDVEG